MRGLSIQPWWWMLQQKSETAHQKGRPAYVNHNSAVAGSTSAKSLLQLLQKSASEKDFVLLEF